MHARTNFRSRTPRPATIYRPEKNLSDKSTEAEAQRELDAAETTNELVLPPANQTFASVTEHTTHQLKQTVPRK